MIRSSTLDTTTICKEVSHEGWLRRRWASVAGCAARATRRLALHSSTWGKYLQSQPPPHDLPLSCTSKVISDLVSLSQTCSHCHATNLRTGSDINLHIVFATGHTSNNTIDPKKDACAKLVCSETNIYDRENCCRVLTSESSGWHAASCGGGYESALRQEEKFNLGKGEDGVKKCKVTIRSTCPFPNPFLL